MNRQRHESQKLIQKLKNMKTKHNFKANLVATAVVIISLGALAANAGQFHRSGSFVNSRGNSGTFEQTIDRQPGQYSRVTTTSGGETATVDQTATRNGDTVNLDGSRTGFDGKTSSWNDTITGNGNGTATVSGQYTRQNGNTVDTSSTVTKTSDGRTAAGTYSTSTGKSGSYSIDIVNADGTHTRTESVTGADGKTVTRVVTTDKDGNTIDRTVTATGPEGQTETHSGSVTFNQ
jgi:hypothetical protein